MSRALSTPCLPAGVAQVRHRGARPFALLVQRKWFDRVALLILIAGFAMTSYGLWMRWEIAGRIPASNMYESLLFLSWGMGLFAILADVDEKTGVPRNARFNLLFDEPVGVGE